MRLSVTINEGSGVHERRTARRSSALRGAEVILTVSFLPHTPACPFSLTCPYLPCNRDPLLLAPPTRQLPLSNRQSDQPEPLQSTDPDHKYLARDRSFDYQSCIYSNGPNPSRTLLQDCHVVFDKTPTDRARIRSVYPAVGIFALVRREKGRTGQTCEIFL